MSYPYIWLYAAYSDTLVDQEFLLWFCKKFHMKTVKICFKTQLMKYGKLFPA